MEKRRCGDTGPELSVLGVGCWAYGGGREDYWGDQDQEDVDRVVRRAVEMGVNYFDTAEAYNDGRSEESLRRAFKGLDRDSVVIGSKISPSNAQPDVLPKHCEDSLRRLGVDTIDVYMMHYPINPPSVQLYAGKAIPLPSMEEAFEALVRLRDQGKIRHIGVSNFGPERLQDAFDFGATVVVNQLPYSLLSRAIEYEILPECRKRGVGIVGYVPLQQGLLTGKYASLDEVPAVRRRTRHFDSRKVKEARHTQTGAEQELQAALDGIRKICDESGLPMTRVALGWAVAKSGITCVLAGARNVRQLEANVEAVSEPLPADMVKELDEITEPLKQRLGPSFDYYEDPENDRSK